MKTVKSLMNRTPQRDLDTGQVREIPLSENTGAIGLVKDRSTRVLRDIIMRRREDRCIRSRLQLLAFAGCLLLTFTVSLGPMLGAVQRNVGSLLWIPWLSNPMKPLPLRTSRWIQGLLGSAVSHTPSLGSSARQLGTVLYRSGDEQGAVSAWRETGAAPYLLSLGRLYSNEGLLTSAEQMFFMALEVEPGLGHAHCELARFYDGAGRRDQALSFYKRSVENTLLEDYSVSCHYELAALLSADGNWCGAEDQLRVAADNLGQSSYLALEILTAYGKAIYHCSANEEGMQIQFRRAVSLELNDIWLLIQYGTFAAQIGEWDSTQYWTNEISIIDPRSAWPMVIQGEYFFNQGELGRAKLYLEKAINRDPTNGIAHYWLGRCYLAQEDYIAALDFAETAVTLDPRVEWHFLLLGNIYTLLGKPEEAVSVYRQALAYGHTDAIFVEQIEKLTNY